MSQPKTMIYNKQFIILMKANLPKINLWFSRFSCTKKTSFGLESFLADFDNKYYKLIPGHEWPSPTTPVISANPALHEQSGAPLSLAHDAFSSHMGSFAGRHGLVYRRINRSVPPNASLLASIYGPPQPAFAPLATSGLSSGLPSQWVVKFGRY